MFHRPLFSLKRGGNLLTLSQLRRELRQRLGSAGQGFWADEDVDLALNSAQRQVAEYLHTPETPWDVASLYQIPCVSGQNRYHLPLDALSIDTITHIREGYRKTELLETNIGRLRNNDYDYTYDSTYSYFEIRGSDSPYISEGVATGGSNNQLIDVSLSRDNQLPFVGICPGDLVFNLADENASASVLSVESGTELIIGNWQGGQRRSFANGDGYRVEQLERTYKTIWIYPVVSFKPKDVLSAYKYTGPTLGFLGTPSAFTPEVDTSITQIGVEITNLDGYDRDTSLIVNIVAAGAQEDILWKWAIDAPKPYNLIETNEIYVKGGTEYLIDITNAESNPVDVANPPNNRAEKVELFGADDRTNHLLVDYVPYPTPLINESSITELKGHHLEPLYAIAKKILWEQRDPESNSIIVFDQVAKQKLLDAKGVMRNLRPREQKKRPYNSDEIYVHNATNVFKNVNDLF